MTTGLILLALLALAAGFFYTKARGKLKLPVNGKHWKGAIIVFVLLVLMFYATSHGHNGH
jgi:succinate dehydrogenase hydrophobic anchor subunit